MRKVMPVLFLILMAMAMTTIQGCSKEEETTTPPTPCDIGVSTPAAGSEFRGGDFDTPGEWVDIRWTQNGNPSTVDIRLLNVAADTLIAAGAPNNGYYAWRAETFGMATGDVYAIEVMGAEDCRDTTGLFTIINQANCDIRFVYSAKDTIPHLYAGDQFTIEWTSTDTSGDLQLELWTTSFWPEYRIQEPFFVIDPFVEDDGAYEWTVSSFNYSADAVYRWVLRDADLNTCVSDPSWHFRIYDNAVCSITVGVFPNKDSYDPGEQMQIDIIGTNVPGLVDIELMADAGSVPGTIVENHDPTQPYLWTVTDFGHTGTPAYRVRVIAADDAYCSGVSDNFSIAR
jgi:hypothetical protein